MTTIGSSRVHVLTDAAGEITAISRPARSLLAANGVERGRSLVDCFPDYRKVLLFDIDVARAGWPTERNIRLSGVSGRSIRYRVSRLLPSGGLYWEFHAVEDQARRSA